MTWDAVGYPGRGEGGRDRVIGRSEIGTASIEASEIRKRGDCDSESKATVIESPVISGSG